MNREAYNNEAEEKNLIEQAHELFRAEFASYFFVFHSTGLFKINV